MQYKSISLSSFNKDDKMYSLLKYENHMKKFLKEIQQINPFLASTIEKCSLNDEDSKLQGYLIVDDEINKCLGGIYIDALVDDNTLNVVLLIKSEEFRKEEFGKEIHLFIHQLIQSLKIYFWDKEQIEIHLLNALRLYYPVGNSNTYFIKNEYNTLVPTLMSEIEITRSILEKSQQVWLEVHDLGTIDEDIDAELIEKYKKQEVSLHEMFYKTQKLEFHINPIKGFQELVTLSLDGNISFNYNQDYSLNYNLNNSNFKVSLDNFRAEPCKLTDTKDYTLFEKGNLSIITDKQTEKKTIEYLSSKYFNPSEKAEIVLDEKGNVEKCYIDIRIHRSHYKVSGTYMFRFDKHFYGNRLSLLYVDKHGTKWDKSYHLKGLENGIDIASIDKIIFELYKYIAELIPRRNKSLVIMDGFNIEGAINQETKAIEEINNIDKSEIPVAILQDQLDNFRTNKHQKTLKMNLD